MFIDPIIVQWVFMAAVAACAFMIGRSSMPTKDEVIQDTIVYLVENNFVKAKKVDGEIEIIPLD